MVNCHAEHCALVVSISLKLLRKQSTDSILHYFSVRSNRRERFLSFIYLTTALLPLLMLLITVLMGMVLNLLKHWGWTALTRKNIVLVLIFKWLVFKYREYW